MNPATLNVCCVSLLISIQFNFLSKIDANYCWATLSISFLFVCCYCLNQTMTMWTEFLKQFLMIFHTVMSRPIWSHLNSQPQSCGFISNLCTSLSGLWVEEYKGICVWWRWAQEYFMGTLRYLQLKQNLRPFVKLGTSYGW